MSVEGVGIGWLSKINRKSIAWREVVFVAEPVAVPRVRGKLPDWLRELLVLVLSWLLKRLA